MPPSLKKLNLGKKVNNSVGNRIGEKGWEIANRMRKEKGIKVWC